MPTKQIAKGSARLLMVFHGPDLFRRQRRGEGNYVLLFRELNEKASHLLDISLMKNVTRAKVIDGRGTALVWAMTFNQ